MSNTQNLISLIINDTLRVFEREQPKDAAQPTGILLVGGANYREEVLTAFKECKYFTEREIPIECAESCFTEKTKIYRIELDYFFR